MESLASFLLNNWQGAIVRSMAEKECRAVAVFYALHLRRAISEVIQTLLKVSHIFRLVECFRSNFAPIQVAGVMSDVTCVGVGVHLVAVPGCVERPCDRR